MVYGSALVQTGCCSSTPGSVVIWVSDDPSGRTMEMFAVLLCVRLKTIYAPSGDQFGFSAPEPGGSESGMSCGSVPSGRTRASTPYGR